MRVTRIIIAVLLTASVMAGIYVARPQTIQPHAKEVHMRNIRQLTFGGENAEAYFALDGQKTRHILSSLPYEFRAGRTSQDGRQPGVVQCPSASGAPSAKRDCSYRRDARPESAGVPAAVPGSTSPTLSPWPSSRPIF